MRHSLLAVVLIFTGCFCEPKVETRYVDRFTEVKVPVKCVVPKTVCSVDSNATYTEVVSSMLKCIADLREAQKVCE